MISTNVFVITIALLLVIFALGFYFLLKMYGVKKFNEGVKIGIKKEKDSPYVYDHHNMIMYGKNPLDWVRIYNKETSLPTKKVLPEFGVDLLFVPNAIKPLERRFVIDSYCIYSEKPTKNRTIITPNGVSDGYHTFEELYYYRLCYNSALANMIAWAKNFNCGACNVFSDIDVIKSKRHFDGEACYGGTHFIVVIKTPYGQISNHYELKYWDMFNCRAVKKAWKYDGHTMKESTERLKKLSNYLKTGLWV